MKLISEDKTENPRVTIEDVNRLLEVGRLLLSVLTQEELDHLQKRLNRQAIDDIFSFALSSNCTFELGNTGVT
jgi:hypothetical protein